MCKQIADCEAVCTRTVVRVSARIAKMPPRRERGGRAGVVTPEVRALQRQVRALQEEIRRGMNLNVRDESEDEVEGEGNSDQEEGEILNQEEERLFRAISKIGKSPKIEVPAFSGNLNPEELID